jgi:deoxyadenosine/deoxycytidine kinase
MQKRITIAIDGHSSCGKSTLAKSLAKKISDQNPVSSPRPNHVNAIRIKFSPDPTTNLRFQINPFFLANH